LPEFKLQKLPTILDESPIKNVLPALKNQFSRRSPKYSFC
jgi:hypothetical protein